MCGCVRGGKQRWKRGIKEQDKICKGVKKEKRVKWRKSKRKVRRGEGGDWEGELKKEGKRGESEAGQGWRGEGERGQK